MKDSGFIRLRRTRARMTYLIPLCLLRGSFIFCFTFLAALLLSSSIYAAPCKFPAFNLFPKIKLYENEGVIYLNPEVSNNLYGFKAEEVYRVTKEKDLAVTDKKEIIAKKELASNYLKVGDSFKIGEVRYTLLEFGIEKEQGEKTTVFKITGIAKNEIEKLLGYAPSGYLKENLEDPNIVESKINIAIIAENKLIVGYGGGFAEGIGLPGGMAVFDFAKDQWIGEWRKELIDLYVTAMVPKSTDTIWFSSKDKQEFFVFPADIYEYNIEKNTLNALRFSDFHGWALNRWDDTVFVIGPDGIIIYDILQKQAERYVWDLAINNDGIIIAKFLKCDKEQCLSKERDRKIFLLYAAQLFEVKDKQDFLKWSDTFFRDVPTRGSDRLFWLPEPFVSCGYGMDMPQDFLKYINIEQLLLHSEANKSPLAWKTITQLILFSRQKKIYQSLIFKASKDPNEGVRRLALECINALNLKEE